MIREGKEDVYPCRTARSIFGFWSCLQVRMYFLILSIDGRFSPERNSDYGRAMIDGFGKASHSTMGHKHLEIVS